MRSFGGINQRFLQWVGFLPILPMVLSCFFLTAVSISAQETSIADILPRVQKNVAALKVRTADFVCGENVWKRQNFTVSAERRDTRGGNFNARIIPAESDGKSFLRSSLSMERTVNTPDGSKTTELYLDNSRKKEKLNSNNINRFDALFSWFDKENENCFDFELRGSEIIGGRDAYKIRAVAKADRKRAGKICESFEKNWNGTFWIDKETMQVVRLLTDTFKVSIPAIYALLTRGTYLATFQFDYSPVLIGKEHFWLPVTNHAIIKKNEKVQIDIEHEYRDYKLFTSSVNINFENPSK